MKHIREKPSKKPPPKRSFSPPPLIQFLSSFAQQGHTVYSVASVERLAGEWEFRVLRENHLGDLVFLIKFNPNDLIVEKIQVFLFGSDHPNIPNNIFLSSKKLSHFVEFKTQRAEIVGFFRKWSFVHCCEPIFVSDFKGQSVDLYKARRNDILGRVVNQFLYPSGCCGFVISAKQRYCQPCQCARKYLQQMGPNIKLRTLSQEKPIQKTNQLETVSEMIDRLLQEKKISKTKEFFLVLQEQLQIRDKGRYGYQFVNYPTLMRKSLHLRCFGTKELRGDGWRSKFEYDGCLVLASDSTVDRFLNTPFFDFSHILADGSKHFQSFPGYKVP